VEKLYNELLKLVPSEARSKSHIILLHGEDTSYRNDTDRELLFRQESNFFWLTGCNLPDSHLVLNYEFGRTSGAYNSHLYIHEEDPLETLWSPAPPNLDEARKLFDARDIAFSKDLPRSLEEILKAHPNHVLHVLPSSNTFPTPPKEVTHQLATKEDRYLLAALHQARLIKEGFEIDLIKQANDISSRAHEVVMRLLGQGVRDRSLHLNGTNGVAKRSGPLMPSEWRISREAEAEAVFVASCRREG
jgi:Xaa-Pro dipeptidase